MKILGYGAHRMWFSREQEALQRMQLREKEVSQSFHICSLCSCIVQENSLQKRQPNGPRLSTEKQVRHFFRSLSDMPFYLKCSGTRFQIHHLTSLREKKA